MAKCYSVTIMGDIPIDFADIKSASATMLKIQEAQSAGDVKGLLKLMVDTAISVNIGDGEFSAPKPNKAATGAKRGRKPKMTVTEPTNLSGVTQTDIEASIRKRKEQNAAEFGEEFAEVGEE